MKPILLYLTLIACTGAYATDDAPFGEACQTDEACGNRLSCELYWGEEPDHLWFPGGLCTLECGGDVCGFSGVCVGWTPTGERLCFTRCGEDDHCRDGWECKPLSSNEWEQACMPALR